MEDLNFLSFGVGDNLPAHIDSVRLIEDVDAHVIGQVGISDLLHRCESNRDYMFRLFSGHLSINIWCTPGTLLMSSSTSIWQ